jgi:signal transduction histidine kinase/CheY-like chemotaxis protein
MRNLNIPTRAYILATYALASTLLILSLRTGSLQFSVEFLTLAILGAIMSPQVVHLGVRLDMSVAHPFILTSMLLVGESEALLMSVICIGTLCLFRTPKMEPHRALFNISAFVITTFLTSRTYQLFNHIPSDEVNGRALIAMMTATLVFYLVNTFSVSIGVALSNRTRIFREWHDNFLWSAPAFFAGGSLALAMSFFVEKFGIIAFILAMPFCILIYYSYKLYLDKLEEKRHHLEDIQKMNADLERKVQERTQELEIVNEKLQRSNADLKRADSLKSEFLANMSHELRTPLNAIIGFSELLLERSFGSLNEEQRDHVADILSSGRHLLELINDILDLSKIESGKMTLSLERFELGPVFDEAAALLKIESARKHLDLVIDLDDPELEVMADRSKIKQILYNLLSNAVKFTPDGGRIRVSGEQKGEKLCVTVADTGIGIPEADHGRIFDAFTQVDASYSRRYQGTGLGLALVKKYVDMHHGRLLLESEVGAGSTFRITIPMLVVESDRVIEDVLIHGEGTEFVPRREVDSPLQRFGAQGVDATTILVVEDNPSSLRLIGDLLRSEGYDILKAVTGEKALDIIRRVRPDLILIDIQLAGMDGLEVVRVLKSDSSTARIPIVALTAHAMEADELRARQAGCVGFIAKPIDTKQFPRQVAEFLNDPAAAMAR